MTKTSKTQLLLYTTYIIADLLDTYVSETARQMEREKVKVDFDTRHTFNTLTASARKLRKQIDGTPKGTQSDFGDTCDMITSIFSVLIDRIGDNERAALDIYEYIKGKPSSLGLQFKGLDDAFFKKSNTDEVKE